MNTLVRIVSLIVITLGAPLAVAGEDARQILEATGVKGGLVVHLGCGDGTLTAALRVNKSYLVHGLDPDTANVTKAREHIRKLGLYGVVSVERFTGKTLPYVDNLVNLVVAEDLGTVPMAEVTRVLAPNAVAYVKQGGRWTKTVKPRPKEIDEWTHYLHDATNNAVADDTTVGPPRRLQWIGSPRWSRHHDRRASLTALVSANGRLFYVFDEAPTASIMLPARPVLIARDAFNGTILWKRYFETWFPHLFPFKSGPPQLARRVVAMGDRVYATLGLKAPLVALDAATGKTVRTYKETDATEEAILSDGLLFALVHPGLKIRVYKPTHGNVGQERNRASPGWGWKRKPRQLTAIEAETGKVLWKKQQVVAPLTLAADKSRLCFHDGTKIVCLDRQTGEEKWTSDPLGLGNRASWTSFGAILIIYGDVVLFAGGDRKMHGLNAKTGKTLWAGKHHRGGHCSPEDLLVLRGVAWSGAVAGGGDSGVWTGYNVKTGKIKSEFRPDVRTYWFHHRCYRSKATINYLLPARTGTEFVDPEKKHWEIHHWVRGGCIYGVMPCNGLLYAPPHSCACYPESKLYGFNALAPAAKGTWPQRGAADVRLEKGPAFQAVNDRPSAVSPSDWPTYRCDAARSGRTKTAVPAELKTEWSVTLGRGLSSPVVAGGRVIVASVDTHTVHALNAKDGSPAWRFTAGGRVDSPPTIYRGRVLFGSADGSVYCLRATDGALVWRFRAAPDDRRTVAFEQVESVWPVHGSVLIQNDVLYCTAGRSMFLDGGVRLLRLDPKTGKKLSETVLDDRDPKTGKNLQVRVKILNMPVALPDVLSSDGKHVYMRSQQFDLEGKRGFLGPHSGNQVEQGSQQAGEGRHLFASGGFLDGSWLHRNYWVYGRSFAGGHGGYYQAGRFTPSGRILAFDEDVVYGYGRKPQYYKWVTPLDYHLFAAKKGAAVGAILPGQGGGSEIAVQNAPSLDPAGKAVTVAAWIKTDKANGVVVARGGAAHGYALWLKGGKPRFAIRVAQAVHAVDAKDAATGGWTHVAGVLRADKALQVYVNGKLSASGKAAGLIAADPKDTMQIGIDQSSPVDEYDPAPAFKGLIDEVRIYHRALTADEIAGLAAGPVKDAKKLVLYYSFDQGKATDESGKKNHGTAGAAPVNGKFGKAMPFSGKVQRRVGGRRTRRPRLGRPAGRLPYRWTIDVPIHARAMVLADKTLFIAGPPAIADEDKAVDKFLDPQTRKELADERDSFEGRKGAVLRTVSAADGKKLSELRLDAPPVWDGMAAAGGRLYLATVDGKLHCLGKK